MAVSGRTTRGLYLGAYATPVKGQDSVIVTVSCDFMTSERCGMPCKMVMMGRHQAQPILASLLHYLCTSPVSQGKDHVF